MGGISPAAGSESMTSMSSAIFATFYRSSEGAELFGFTDIQILQAAFEIVIQPGNQTGTIGIVSFASSRLTNIAAKIQSGLL
jgi:hypothetical protein